MILGFKDQFVPYVREGSKTHSVRSGNRWQVGMRADLFEKVRQKNMRLIFRAPVVRVQEFLIDVVWGPSHINYLGSEAQLVERIDVWVDGEKLDSDERDMFAWRDGFRHRTASVVSPATEGCFWLMAMFWQRQHKICEKRQFHGQIVHWDYAARFMDGRAEKRRIA